MTAIAGLMFCQHSPLPFTPVRSRLSKPFWCCLYFIGAQRLGGRASAWFEQISSTSSSVRGAAGVAACGLRPIMCAPPAYWRPAATDGVLFSSRFVFLRSAGSSPSAFIAATSPRSSSFSIFWRVGLEGVLAWLAFFLWMTIAFLYEAV